ncbi:TMEM165/GDT1 family protein [Salinirubellus salinus]|uniref:TMEM165/GDT1 family protein n=1 Tax=Salinirubellus salinus TaxID=1364945 RepID=A0A9E7R561_9EURY|nr:TMEM165/GDT1 family protein [Salinirubellus salinus]UWM55661.1 TMEM165/GDT1 family protein [Salinirubellus salinus]
MASFLEILVAAATLQLLVLPGEKVQMIIAGLSTKYRPGTVVAGAGVAFGGWTALEVAFGEAVKGALPAVYLDAITGVLFVVFAVLLANSARTLDGESEQLLSDGGTASSSAGLVARLDARLPDRFEGFVPAFSASAFGEFGDKTQVVTIGLAVQYGAHPAIWLGEMLAIIPVSLLTAFAFNRGAHRLSPDQRRYVLYGAAVLFLLFAADVAAGYWFGVSVTPV